jgi:hypothetical protein
MIWRNESRQEEKTAKSSPILLAYSESLIAKNMLPLSAFRTLGDMAMYRFLHRRKRAFRESELNKADATFSQSNSVDSN